MTAGRRGAMVGGPKEPTLRRRALLHARHYESNAMTLSRRRFLHLAAGAAALPAGLRRSWAQTYPARPVTLVVPAAPGGATDFAARLLAEGLTKALGVQFVVENKGCSINNTATT